MPPGHSVGSSWDSGLSCYSEMLPETGFCLTNPTDLALVPCTGPLHLYSLLGKSACCFWAMSLSLPDLCNQPALYA